MLRNHKLIAAKAVVALAAVPCLMWAHEYGPDPGYSGVPRENPSCISAQCHVGTANDPANKGSVKVTFGNGTNYVPGVKQHLVVTTDAKQGALRQIVNDEGFRDLAVPAGVASRFSVLTAAGLFPAAVGGVRIEDVLAGAAWMDQRTRSPVLWENPALLLAAMLYLAETRASTHTVVLMPYSDRLRDLARWFAQLWAESLGKAVDLDGRKRAVGTTPQAAVGVSDQHSLLQLWLDGPADRVVCFVRVEDHGREIEIPSAYGDLEGVGYLRGKGLGALLNMEQRATELALQQRGRLSLTLSVPELNAFTLGQLVFLFEAVTVFAASLHRVDSWNQPAAEEGRQLTFGLAGRKAWEDRDEVEAWLAAKATRPLV